MRTSGGLVENAASTCNLKRFCHAHFGFAPHAYVERTSGPELTGIVKAKPSGQGRALGMGVFVKYCFITWRGREQAYDK